MTPVAPAPVALTAGTTLTAEQVATCTAGDTAGGAVAFGCVFPAGDLAYTMPDGTSMVVVPNEPLPTPVLAAVTAAAEAPAPISNVNNDGPGGRTGGNIMAFYKNIENVRKNLEFATGKTFAIVYSQIPDMETGDIAWMGESSLRAPGSHVGSLAASQADSIANVHAAAAAAGIPESQLEIILRNNF